MSVNDKLAEYISFPPRSTPEFDTDLMYGLEFEYENASTAFETMPSRWNVTHDGSLRDGGVEFVSQTLKRDDLDEALRNLAAVVEPSKARASSRCGIHVHMNCRPLTVAQLYSLLTTYVLVEPALFRRFFPDRESSSFCVPVYRNQHMIRLAHQTIQAARQGDSVAFKWLTQTSKYSALNTASLARFGTLEFRHFPGTKDFNAARQWIDLLTKLYDENIRDEDPQQVITRFEDTGDYRTYVNTVLGFSTVVPVANQQRAYKAATILAGFPEPTWEELDWLTPLEA